MSSCVYCGSEVTSSKPNVNFCRTCFYTCMWVPDHPRYGPLMDQLNRLPNVWKADAWHTGGGCFGVMVFLEDGRIVFATDAYEHEGKWSVEAGLPSEGQPWGIGVYASAEVFYEGEAEFFAPLTDTELLAVVGRL